MLRYIQESDRSNAVDEATREIDGYVEAVKTDPVVVRYCCMKNRDEVVLEKILRYVE